MPIFSPRGQVAVLLAATLLSAGLPPGANAQTDTMPHRVRGTVSALADHTLTVKTREGAMAAITLAEDWKLVGVTAATVGDIVPGSYVGIASLPMKDGRDGALEVLIFPAAMAGAGEGSFPWDLQPESTMTNATVAAVGAVDGATLTLSYKGTEKAIVVPDGAPVVTFGAASLADLAKGATVFVPALIDKAGTITTHTVVVGTNGTVPPM